MRHRLVILSAATAACATPAQEGRLFRQDIAAVSRFHVADASAQSTDVFAELSGGTTCRGRISRTDAVDMSVGPAEDRTVTSDGGVGVLVCSSNTVLRCRLVHRYANSYAYGECTDQSGVKYTVVF